MQEAKTKERPNSNSISNNELITAVNELAEKFCKINGLVNHIRKFNILPTVRNKFWTKKKNSSRFNRFTDRNTDEEEVH